MSLSSNAAHNPNNPEKVGYERISMNKFNSSNVSIHSQNGYGIAHLATLRASRSDGGRARKRQGGKGGGILYVCVLCACQGILPSHCEEGGSPGGQRIVRLPPPLKRDV